MPDEVGLNRMWFMEDSKPIKRPVMTRHSIWPPPSGAFLAACLIWGTLAWADAAESVVVKARLVILGNSLSAGYGVETDQSFPALLQRKIDRAGRSPCEVVNAGVSGDTSAAGLRRVDWVLRRGVDYFILELGGNDGLRGISPLATKANLQMIIDKVRHVNSKAKILIAGMKMPPSVGKEYEAEFSNIFPALASSNRVTLIPFLLDRVAGDPKLNLPDMIHPNPEGHQIVAETVWKVLEPVMAEGLHSPAGPNSSP